jgi:hypothetical protein
MSGSKILLVGAVALVAVMFAGVVDYTHANSARHAAEARAMRDFRAEVLNVYAARGEAVTARCGNPPTSFSCIDAADASVPAPSLNLGAVDAVAEQGWKLRRVWYVFAATAVAILTGALALVARDREPRRGRRQAPPTVQSVE